MEKLICQAISDKRILSFTYENSVRRVEPHAFGYSKKGVLSLSAWQLSGGSAIDWRAFHIAKMSAVALTDEMFLAPRADYNRASVEWESLICAL